MVKKIIVIRYNVFNESQIFSDGANVLYSTGSQEGVVITLDGAQATFISSNKLVFSLKGGEMWDDSCLMSVL